MPKFNHPGSVSRKGHLFDTYAFICRGAFQNLLIF
ncbi:hypothetical protein T12_6724 [Trichinella patagoniensis]|uniref:Uncharacterized protein n=1 Tax=Trichinella patagoniensis TaxID=990121 RepID=A0A0V0YKM3_9BILA|nr:hypothetical protein T12_6724 [Trichinella patagoniensis]